MNKLIRNLLISASLATATQAAPFMAIGDGAELFVTGVVGVRGDDNVLLGSGVPERRNASNQIIQAASPEVEDLIFDFNPGLELTWGKNAQLQGALTLVESITRYSDRNYLDTELFGANLTTAFDDGKTKYGFNAGFNELNQNTPDVRGLVRRDVINMGANAEFGMTEKTSLGLAATYVSEDYDPRGFIDSDTLTLPVKLFYKMTPKVDLALGYQYRKYDGTGGTDAKDGFYSIGARGNFTPKLTGAVHVGLTERKYNGQSSKSMLGIDSSLAYELSEKSALQFGAVSSFDVAPTGGLQKNLVINSAFTNKLSEEWTFRAGASWRRINYYAIGQTHDYLEGNIGATYIINANVKIVGTYVHRTYLADIEAIEFKNNVFSIAASFRY